jgi:hypothetical protein
MNGRGMFPSKNEWGYLYRVGDILINYKKNFIVKNFGHKKTCIEAGHQTHHKS